MRPSLKQSKMQEFIAYIGVATLPDAVTASLLGASYPQTTSDFLNIFRE